MTSVADRDVGPVTDGPDRPQLARADERFARLRTLAAIVIGAGVPLAGFPPFNTMTDRLPVDEHAWAAFAAPAFLLVFLAAIMAVAAPVARTTKAPRTLVAGMCLLIAAGALSLLETDTVNDSVAIGLLGIVAPVLLGTFVRRADLSLPLIVWAFLATTSVLLLRADFVFFETYGFGPPSGDDLFTAKFTNAPYDFHYYGLGNPDQTATFTLIPFAIGCWLASDRDTVRRERIGAAIVAAVCGLSLLLLYIRVPLALATVIAVVALLRSPAGRATKFVALGALGLVALRFIADETTLKYLKQVFDTDSSASGVERLTSMFDGFRAFGDHPLTGVGLGRYGYRDGDPPAHSAVAQLAADMGLLGLIGGLLVIGSMVALAVRHARRRDAPVLTVAVAVGLGVYAVAATLVGGATAGVAVGFVSVWGLTVGLLLGVATAPERSPAWLPAQLRSGPAAAAAFERAWARVRARLARLPAGPFTGPIPGMVLYGVLLGIGTAVYLAQALPAQIELIPTRVEDLEAVFAAHAQGKGPLVGFIRGEGFYPSGMADNPGLAWLLPPFADILGLRGWGPAFRAFFIATLSIGAAVLPSLCGRMFRSVLAGVLVPLVALYCFRFVNIGDVYFLLAVAAGIGLPALLVVDRQWERSRAVPPAGLIAVMVFASLMGMFRNGSGTPLLVVALVVVWLHTSWRHKVPALLITLVAFFSISHGFIRIVEAQRKDNMGHTRIAASQAPLLGVSHFDDPQLKRRSIPWHLFYIGLGFDTNEYGIQYLDESGIDYALSVDPRATYGTPLYNEVLQDRYMKILREDPGFIVNTTFRKGLVVADDGLRRFPFALVVIVAVVLLTRRRSRERRWVLLLLLAGASALLYPLAVMPLPRYELAWFSALAWIFLLGLGWTLARVEPAFARRLGANTLVGRRRWREATIGTGDHLVATAAAQLGRSEPSRRQDPLLSVADRQRIGSLGRRRLGGALAICLVTLGVVRLAAASPQDALKVGTTSPTSVYSEPVAESPVRRWDFSAGVPAGWENYGARITPDESSFGVRTTTTPTAYQLATPPVRLKPGNYVAKLRGGVIEGGLQLGALDVASNAWLATAQFRAERLYSQEVGFPVAFTVSEAQRVQIILANYAGEPEVSLWRLDDLVIRPASREDTIAISGEDPNARDRSRGRRSGSSP